MVALSKGKEAQVGATLVVALSKGKEAQVGATLVVALSKGKEAQQQQVDRRNSPDAPTMPARGMTPRQPSSGFRPERRSRPAGKYPQRGA